MSHSALVASESVGGISSGVEVRMASELPGNTGKLHTASGVCKDEEDNEPLRVLSMLAIVRG
jgi:hypothetical protein